MGIKHTILKLGIGCLRVIYAPMKLQRQQNRITIISRQSREASLDIELLAAEIRRQSPGTICQVMVKFIEPGIGSKIGYAFHMIEQMKAIARSKVVVIDGYCIAASVLNHRPDTEIIQMWHSMAAIKKFGRQTVDRESGHSSQIADIMYMHRNYTRVICPSQRTGEFFCQGFGCSEDKLELYCLPRIDFIRGKTAQDEPPATASIQQKEILLYAPTFRKNEGISIRELFQSVDYDRFTLVVKPHPLYEENFQRAVEEMDLQGKVIVDSEKSTFEWLKLCDRVITDYSAVAVESLVTEKPLYFYVYDIEDYERTTGLNVNPLEEVPTITARTGRELGELLQGEYDRKALESFRDTYLTADTENCTEKLAEFIIGVANGNT